LPKNEKRVIYSALRCSKPVWKTKEDDILKNVGNKTVDFHRYDGSQWLPWTVLNQHSSKYLLLLCFIQVWNNMRASKWWQHCWVHCPFKAFFIPQP